MFELVSTAVLGVGLIGLLWFAFRHGQYRSLLTAGFLVGVMVFGVVSQRHRAGLVGSAAMDTARWFLWGGFALQYVYMFLQFRDGYRRSVAEYESRKRRENG